MTCGPAGSGLIAASWGRRAPLARTPGERGVRREPEEGRRYAFSVSSPASASSLKPPMLKTEA
jgi:hypothetical protein